MGYRMPDRPLYLRPHVPRLITLVDALRVGRARERKLAASMLQERLEEVKS